MKVFEVVVHPVAACVEGLLVLGQPVLEGLKVPGLEAVQAAAPLRPGADEPDLAQYP